MFDPISARLASSCSRNGMSAVATDTVCLGEISISSTLSGGNQDDISPVARGHPLFSEPSALIDLGVRLGDDVLILLIGGQVLRLLAHNPVAHKAVGRLNEP